MQDFNKHTRYLSIDSVDLKETNVNVLDGPGGSRIDAETMNIDVYDEKNREWTEIYKFPKGTRWRLKFVYFDLKSDLRERLKGSVITEATLDKIVRIVEEEQKKAARGLSDWP